MMKRLGLFLVIVVFGLRVSAQSAVNDSLKFAENKHEISTFLNLMHVSGLDSIYQGKPVTIFAPDNKAFDKLPTGLLDSLSKPANQQVLIAVLNTYIIPGKLKAKDIALLLHHNNGQTIFTTLSGNKLVAKVNVNRNIVLVDENGRENIVKQFDIQHSNAVFFIIDSVIFPKK